MYIHIYIHVYTYISSCHYLSSSYCYDTGRLEMSGTISTHIFSNLYLMYFDVAVLRDRTLAHSPSFCVACVWIYPPQWTKLWTVTTAVPAAWTPLLTARVQTSSPAALEHARHEVSHYFLFPASSSSWHTLLQFKSQMSDVIVQSFQTQPLVFSSASAPCQTYTPQFPFFIWQGLWGTDSISFSSEISVQ